MTLTSATAAFGIFLIILGIPFVWKGRGFAPAYFKTLRSAPLAALTFGGGGLWFLWHILHLGKADYGDYRGVLTLLFGAIIVGSFFWVRDFLAVRGYCLLYLLCAAPLLDAAYAKAVPSKVVMVACVYAGILVAIYWGAVPFKARNFGEWLFGSEARARAFGGLLLLLGAAQLGVAAAY